MAEFGVIVNKGFEKAAVRQIRELTGSKDITVDDAFVTFRSDEMDAFAFIYRSQISLRALLMLSKTEFSDDGLVERLRKSMDLSFLQAQYNRGIKNFRVKVDIHGHDESFDVTELEKSIGGIVLDSINFIVDLKRPEVTLYVYVRNNTAYVGIDLSGDLSKRDYRIFNNAVSIKGTTAFGLLMLADYSSEDIYLNPFCYAGTLEIEAALYASKKSHRFYNKNFPFMKFFDEDWDKLFQKSDKDIRMQRYPIIGSDTLLSSVTASVKNAKIAGVEECIDFKRLDMDWMDVKFEEKQFSKIITFVPGSSKHKDLTKLFKEFFYEAEYVLKDDGIIVMMCLSKDLLIPLSKEYFDIDKESTVESGEQALHVIFLRKRGEKVEGA